MKRIFPDYFVLNVVFSKGVREVWETLLFKINHLFSVPHNRVNCYLVAKSCLTLQPNGLWSTSFL